MNASRCSIGRSTPFGDNSERPPSAGRVRSIGRTRRKPDGDRTARANQRRREVSPHTSTAPSKRHLLCREVHESEICAAHGTAALFGSGRPLAELFVRLAAASVEVQPPDVAWLWEDVRQGAPVGLERNGHFEVQESSWSASLLSVPLTCVAMRRPSAFQPGCSSLSGPCG